MASSIVSLSENPADRLTNAGIGTRLDSRSPAADDQPNADRRMAFYETTD
ncbi:MAG TPA: hypothetical protein VII92_10995 [Anaerolineae bacterium]